MSSSGLVQVDEGVEANYIPPAKDPNGSGGSANYKAAQVSSTKTVRTHPTAFPADIAAALIGLGAAFSLYQVPTTLNKFLAFASLGSTLVSSTDTTNYEVTRYVYWLKKPTSTSAGYYIFKVRNTKTGKIGYTRSWNIGKNGI